MPFLTEKFDLTIISSNVDDKLTAKIDENVKVVRYKRDLSLQSILKGLLKLFFNKDVRTEIKEVLKDKENIFKRLVNSLKYYLNAECFYEYLRDKDILTPETDSLFYSYWANHKLLAISLNRSKHPNITLITRVHGYDLYNDRNPHGRLPFRSNIDKNVDRIIFASEYGRKYYLKTHNKDRSKKYPIFKLGVRNDFGPGKYHKTEYITIVSCSNVIPLKRVDLIIKALALIKDINIKWIHFGDGVSFEEIKELAHELLHNKRNISFEFKGHVDYKEIHKYYQENIVDAFITTSSSEGGCPVSIQEAISYGVPVIGTNIGGITEMINGNGFLLSEDPSAEELADNISKIYHMDEKSYIKLRNQSRTIWKNEYNSNKNHKLFVDYINDLQ